MTLFVVATPIGHRGDISRRAVEVLAGCDAVLAEDTRHTRPLLAGLGVETPLVAFHDHTSDGLRARLVERLVSGETLALVSDAGTPSVSDPGYKLVRDARAAGSSARCPRGVRRDRVHQRRGAPLRSIPVRRLRAAEGRREGERRRRLAPLRRHDHLLRVAAAPRRAAPTLAERGAGREVAVGRELTKQYEEP